MKEDEEKNLADISLTNKNKFQKINIINEKPEKENNELNDNNSSKSNISKINFSEISIKENEDQEQENYMESQLALLYDIFLNSYSKKVFADLIKDIEEKEILLYSNSIMSFKIMILKIKCLIKTLMIEYNNILQSKVQHFNELDTIVLKIQNEFKKISSMVINNNSYEHEILTQTYCKFLYLLSKISLKKEDNAKTIGYISLGVNMLKIFIIRKKLATEIKTYKIYLKLLLSIINILIGDNNYEIALLYCRTALKLIEITHKLIYSKNKEKDKNNNKSESIFITKKFITFSGYTFLYIGCCLEQAKKDIEAFEAYKQAKYFLNKGYISENPFKIEKYININNSAKFCVKEIFDKFVLKFEKEKRERLDRQEKLERLKRLQKNQIKQNEKQYKLKLIANGYIGDPNKYNKMEERLATELFPFSVKNEIDKIDDELISFVFTHYNKNNNKQKTPIKNKMSLETKKLMSRYELYNILMSKDFREFVMKTRKLEFNNPKKGSESISTIQRYLNNKMEIKLNQRNNSRKKSLKFLERQNNSIKFNLNLNNIINTRIKKENISEKARTLPATSPSSNSNLTSKREKKLILSNLSERKIKKKEIKFNINNLTSPTQNSPITRNKINLKFSTSNRTIKAMSTKRRKKIRINNMNELECDFERKNFDKNLMTENYLKKYSYYQNLSNKELKMHKIFLDFRNSNIIYNPKKTLEENDIKLITKEEIMNKFLMINEKVREKENSVPKDEGIKMIKDSFASGENEMSSKMKSAMSKVINQYILERKKKGKKIIKLLNDEQIKQINEKNILELNYSIKDINNKLSQIRQVSGNNSTE